MTFLEQLQRTPQPTYDGVEQRLADERQLAEQLQGVPQVLAGSLEGGIAWAAAAALQGAAPLGAAPAVHHRATLARRARHGQAPRHGTAVDAVAAVGQQTCGRHDAGNVARPGRASQQRLLRPTARCPRIDFPHTHAIYR